MGSRWWPLACPLAVEMTFLSNNGWLDRVECLVAELKAVERRDADYWRSRQPDVCEKLAWVARQARCREILSQLRWQLNENRCGMKNEATCSDFVTEVNLAIEGSAPPREPSCVADGLVNHHRSGQTRHQLEADVTVRAAEGLIPGRAQDISASGIAVILPVELPIGTALELEIKLPTAPVTTTAVVRNRNAFLYGLEFVHPLCAARYQAGPDDCKDCGGTGFILQALDGKRRIAFAQIGCRHCGGTGHNLATHT